MRRHDRSMHQGQRKRIHVCPYCAKVNPKTNSTFNSWKKHPLDTHPTFLHKCNPLMDAEYAAGFKLDRWRRLHKLEENDADLSYMRIAELRADYGTYPGKTEGRPPGPPTDGKPD